MPVSIVLCPVHSAGRLGLIEIVGIVFTVIVADAVELHPEAYEMVTV